MLSLPGRMEAWRERYGKGVVWNDRLLRALAMASVAENWVSGMLGAVVLVFGVRELGFGPGALGTIFAIGGISSIFGSIYAGWAARRFGFGTALVGGYAVYMLTILFIPMARAAAIRRTDAVAGAVGRRVLHDVHGA